MLRVSIIVFIFVLSLIFSASGRAQGPDNGPDVTVDAVVKTATVTKLAKGLREAYVFPDVGEKAAAMLEAHLAQKDYDPITSSRSFGELLTKQLFDVAHDKHLRVRYSSEPVPDGDGMRGPPPAGMAQQQKKRNFDFVKVERLNGNLGYLRLDGFMDPAGAGPVAAGAMAFLANTDALIIDLRQNGGGRPDMVAYLATYFFPAGTKVHLNDLSNRTEGTTKADLMESWTLASVPGDRYLEKEVYILTSPRTFSGAEEFSYDLQALKRVTLVGETSGGGANPGGPYRLSDHFVAFMPRGRAINPVTKTNWEGVGVVPEVKVAQADALNAAQALALKHLIAKTTDERELGALKQALALVDAPAADPGAAKTGGTSSPLTLASIAGIWTGKIVDPGGNAHPATFDIKVDSSNVSGTITGGPPAGAPIPIVKGTLEGDQLSLTVTIPDPDGNPAQASFTGKVTGNEFVGQLKAAFADMSFTVTRK